MELCKCTVDMIFIVAGWSISIKYIFYSKVCKNKAITKLTFAFNCKGKKLDPCFLVLIKLCGIDLY